MFCFFKRGTFVSRNLSLSQECIVYHFWRDGADRPSVGPTDTQSISYYSVVPFLCGPGFVVFSCSFAEGNFLNGSLSCFTYVFDSCCSRPFIFRLSASYHKNNNIFTPRCRVIKLVSCFDVNSTCIPCLRCTVMVWKGWRVYTYTRLLLCNNNGLLGTLMESYFTSSSLLQAPRRRHWLVWKVLYKAINLGPPTAEKLKLMINSFLFLKDIGSS